MNLNLMIEKVKAQENYPLAGMILAHTGVVRATSRDGQEVTGLRVESDLEKLEEILEEMRKTPGIIAVDAEIASDQDLKIGDTVMHLVVAGDIRENVIATLSTALNRIKAEVTKKTQFFVS